NRPSEGPDTNPRQASTDTGPSKITRDRTDTDHRRREDFLVLVQEASLRSARRRVSSLRSGPRRQRLHPVIEGTALRLVKAGGGAIAARLATLRLTGGPEVHRNAGSL